MSPENQDQPIREAEGGSGEESKGFDESFEAGWKKYEEERDLAIAKSDKGSDTPTKDVGGQDQAKPTKGDGKQPYKILKVGGKDIPVYSKEELATKIAEMYGEDDKVVDLAQLSQDYTRKRQADSADRKKWEEEYQRKADDLNALGRRFNDIWSKLQGDGKIDQQGQVQAQAQEKPVEKPVADIFKEYNLDPEFAQDHEKKLIQDVVGLRETIKRMDEAIQSSSQAIHFFQVRETVQEMARIIDEEKKTAPFEDILDDEGKSLTLREFSTLITSKAKEMAAQGKKLNLDALTRETVREISTKQAKTKASVEISDDMSDEEFAKRFPKLAARYGKAAGQSAVDKHLEQESKLPPSLDRRTKDVDLKKQPASDAKGPKGIEAQLDAAFSDPDIINALRGV